VWGSYELPCLGHWDVWRGFGLAGRGDKVELRIGDRSDGTLFGVEHLLLVDIVIVGLEHIVGVDPLSRDLDIRHGGSIGAGDRTGAGAEDRTGAEAEDRTGAGAGDRTGTSGCSIEDTSGVSEGVWFYPFLPFL
jgi:hypothetical protein